MWKKWRAARKLKKFRKKNPRQNIDPNTGMIIVDESHVVCFVNDEYPLEHISLAVIDATSSWFYTHASARSAMRWWNRRSNPVVLKVPATFEMERLLENPIIPPHRTVSYFAGEPIAICIGPMWNSDLYEYNIPYEIIEYE